MGGLTDAIMVGVSGGGAATVLVKSLFSWLTSRREVEKVTVAVESPAGSKIEIACGSADDAERLFRTWREAFDKDA